MAAGRLILLEGGAAVDVVSIRTSKRFVRMQGLKTPSNPKIQTCCFGAHLVLRQQL